MSLPSDCSPSDCSSSASIPADGSPRRSPRCCCCCCCVCRRCRFPRVVRSPSPLSSVLSSFDSLSLLEVSPSLPSLSELVPMPALLLYASARSRSFLCLWISLSIWYLAVPAHTCILPVPSSTSPLSLAVLTFVLIVSSPSFLSSVSSSVRRCVISRCVYHLLQSSPPPFPTFVWLPSSAVLSALFTTSSSLSGTRLSTRSTFMITHTPQSCPFSCRGAAALWILMSLSCVARCSIFVLRLISLFFSRPVAALPLPAPDPPPPAFLVFWCSLSASARMHASSHFAIILRICSRS